MSIQFDKAPAALAQPAQDQEEVDFGEWDLDVSIVESGPAADKLIRMTDDGCGQTCQSACMSTCP
ncbi:FxLD family lanthipeptide [Sphaerisporangium sp. NPDC051017]|uniref:FxLD family lanthipeptide n=1 Tax=Sphaerisporangium sp. NPDC051017 TaxID=3154636 RepID=UPI003412EE1D